jgi:arylsulfatase A-like enzyme/Flp pilus assembly protein TadD
LAASTLTRAAIAVVAVTAIAVAVWSWVSPPFRLPEGGERNVLFVTIDTLRADALGSYGGRASTPILDALAARGARFTFAHAHAVVTLPSHTSLMTGQYPYMHGVRDNNGYRVAADSATLAVRLKAAGFATGAFVGAFPLDQRFGLGRGFDVYDDRISEVGTTVDFALPERRADAVVSAATSWLGQQSTKWLAWVHVFDPHAPYQPPPEYASRYPDSPYAAEVAWTDAALGPLFDALSRQSRPTLVVITSDHGESLGEHGELTHGIFAYEATLRVPLLIAEVVPGATRAPRAVTVTTPVRHVDILPTILDAVGIDAEEGLAGRSLRNLIADIDDLPRPGYFEAMTANLNRGWAPLRGVLEGTTKFIDLPLPELYSLDDDPGEQRNFVAIVVPEEIRRFNNLLRGFNVSPPGPPGEETAAVLDRLRALGYIGGTPTPVRERYEEADDPKRLIDLDRLLHEAGDLFARGRLPEAAQRFADVIARRPDTADAYRYLAFVQWEAGRAADAIATLEGALARGITQRDVRVKLGLYLAHTGAAARAISILESMSLDDSEVLNALGIAYGQAGRVDDARRTFERALTVDPTSGLAHQNLATLHLRARNYPAAEASLRRALTIDASLPGAHTALGVVLSQTGRRTEALDAWRRAVSLDPSELDALYNLTVELFAIGQTDEARRFGQQYLSAASPELAAADIARVQALMRGGRL